MYCGRRLRAPTGHANHPFDVYTPCQRYDYGLRNATMEDMQAFVVVTSLVVD